MRLPFWAVMSLLVCAGPAFAADTTDQSARRPEILSGAPAATLDQPSEDSLASPGSFSAIRVVDLPADELEALAELQPRPSALATLSTTPAANPAIAPILSARRLTQQGVPQEEGEQDAPQDETEPGLSQEEIDKFNEAKKAAKKEKVEQAAEQDQSGNDPRVFTNKWMPFYRHTELNGGLVQQDLTGFGTVGFSPVVGMFYELPLAQHRDLSGVPGFPPDTESTAIGVGDVSLKFLFRPKALDFHYGKEGKKSGSLLFGTDFVLPTATNQALGGNAFVFAPIVALVVDMPAHGFFAMLNLYYFDVYKTDSAPETSRYVGRWFYMQPLTPPGRWWGLFFLMPEFQPIYDFETEDSSLWIGVELGKILAPGKVAYIKPGWGIDNSEPTDRKSTFEFGFRWFF